MESTPEASDEALFLAYQRGDQGAFETLFGRYRLPLRRHLERMLGDRQAAEDLVVETFLRAHRHRRRFRPGASVRPWLYTIARNLARNRRRRDRLAGWLPLAAADAAVPVAPPTGADAEIQRRVAAAFAALPERQREACSLRLLGELSVAEIARVTGTSAGTVKSRLFYGQRRLRGLLADLDPGAAGEGE